MLAKRQIRQYFPPSIIALYGRLILLNRIVTSVICECITNLSQTGSPQDLTQFTCNLILIFTGIGVDYDSGPYTVTFPAGVTTVSFNIPITDDRILESDEDFNLIIDASSLPNDVTTGSPQQATVTIAEDDCK